MTEPSGPCTDTATRIDRCLWSIAIVVGLAACAAPLPPESAAADEPVPYTLRLIGQRTLAHRLPFGGTTVGGISGIDYDPAADLYYLISDDPGAFGPNRFYTARLSIDANRFSDVALQTVVALKRPDGSPFPPHAADSEAIRYDAGMHALWWTSEGERKVGRRMTDPFIRSTAVDGRFVGEVPLPPMFGVDPEARGPRDNLVFEGATLSIDGRSLWVSMEGSLIQDGPMPTMTGGAWSRFSRYDREDRASAFGAMRVQYAYPIDPVPAAGAWTAREALNGVSEILMLDETRMLVLERAFVFGPRWHPRLYEATWNTATAVQALASLATSPSFVPMKKRLVLDFDRIGITVDNLEGLCFGPTLANGHRTLVFVSDDNFNPGQATQFLAFEIVPR